MSNADGIRRVSNAFAAYKAAKRELVQALVEAATAQDEEALYIVLGELMKPDEGRVHRMLNKRRQVRLDKMAQDGEPIAFTVVETPKD